MIQNYKSVPTVIQAIKYTGAKDCAEEILKWVPDSIIDLGTSIITIPTPSGDVEVNIGDYVIRGTHDEFYPCKSDIFEERYNPFRPILKGDYVICIESSYPIILDEIVKVREVFEQNGNTYYKMYGYPHYTFPANKFKYFNYFEQDGTKRVLMNVKTPTSEKQVCKWGDKCE